MRRWILPSIFGLFMMLSCVTLSSIMPSLAGRQLVYFLIAGGLFAVISQISLSTLIEERWKLYAASVISLIIPFIFSMTTRGTARWIQFADGVVLQPSQFTLVLLAPALAYSISSSNVTWPVIARVGLLLAIPAGLISLQPDLDTVLVLVASVMSLLFFAGMSWRKIGTLLSLMVILVMIGWSVVLEPYQQERITSFLSVQSGEGYDYNARQALIAVGSGGLFGAGIGQGTQSQLRFLPERHTDFIFSSLSEEYGFVGTSLVLLLYLALVSFLFWIAPQLNTLSARLIMLLIAVSIGLQSSINMGMNMGLLPIAGITLPMLSYGGSAVVAMGVTLGLAQSLILHSPKRVSLRVK